ncbi:MAG: hypothetical protein R3D86_11370 [Emcibacteraceae bacterium]
MLKKLITIFIFSLLSLPTVAKEVESTINLYGNVFTYGIPPWIDPNAADFKEEDLLKKSKYFKDQKGPSFIIEAIPVDQEFDSWTTIFAIKALNLGQAVPISRWEDQTLNTFRQTCGDVSIEYLDTGSTASLVQIICPKVLGYTQDGYNDGVGEIALFAFYISGTTLISHYIEWRGKAFHPLDKAAWPVDDNMLSKQISALKKTTVISKKGIIKFAD